jgi:hypothetical protein
MVCSWCAGSSPLLRWGFGRHLFLFLGILPLLGLAGCGSDDGLNRKAVKGKVTVNGVDIPNGSITFEPLYAGGVGSGAVISQGAYSIAQKDGLPPGKYRVQATGDDGENFTVSEGKMPGDEIMPPKKQLVPPGWKEEIEVLDAGPFEFDFDIKGKK